MLINNAHNEMKVKIEKQYGFGLLEAMIALFIFSIGLLGTFGMQAASMNDNRSALWQSQAVWAAYDMSDRMRANVAGVGADDYDGADTSDAGVVDPGCISTGCTPQGLANTDIFEWKAAVENLPNGQGMIDLVGGRHRIRVMWDGEGNGATGTGCVPTVATDLTCIDMTIEL